MVSHGDECCCGCNALERISQDNRPALSRFNYRIGTYGSIREFLFHQLDKTPELRNWTHRAPDDPAVALIEGAAILGDILTFYQETYANEAFLRTADWRESIGNLVRLLGYSLSPAVGGNAVFAFELKKEEPVSIPIGFPVKATLEELPKPVEFETTEEITAYPWLNRFNLYRPLDDPDIMPSTTEFYIALPEQLIDPIELKVGDRLLVGEAPAAYWWPGPDKFTNVEIVIIDSIREQHGQKIYKIKGNLQRTNDISSLAVYRIGRSFHHFGYNSPAKIVDTSSPVTSTATVSGPTTSTSATIPYTSVPMIRPVKTTFNYFSGATITGTMSDVDFPIDAEVKDLTNGGTIIIQATYTYPMIATLMGQPLPIQTSIRRVKDVRTVTMSWGGVSGTVSQLRLLGDLGSSVGADASMFIAEALFHEVTSPLFSIKAVKTEKADTEGTNLNFYGTADQVNDLDNRCIMLEYQDSDSRVLTVSVPDATASATDDFLQLRPVTVSEDVEYEDFPIEDPTVTVFGNLANADEGKSLPETPVGSGDETQIFQNFKLPKAPLTYHIVPANTPSETPEIAIYVDGRLWKQVDSFFGRGKDEQIYIVREDAEGNSWVQFGDGKTGARLTTGFKNVTAVFRMGDGAYGPLKQDTKVQASAKLKNLDKIGMPMDATGGAQPEDSENARIAAPGKIQSLGRIVSLKDFESEALAIAGVASATAEWQLVDNVPAVVVTVLMDTGRSVEIDAVRNTLDAYNMERGAARHSISVVPGKRMYVMASVEYALKPTYRADIVELEIRRALGVNYGNASKGEVQTGLLSLRKRKFGVREYASTIEGWVQNVEGVLWSRAVALEALTDDDDPEEIVLPSISGFAPVVECDSLHILSLYNKHLSLTAVMDGGS